MALKMNQTVFAQELVLKYESWKVLREILPYEFFNPKVGLRALHSGPHWLAPYQFRKRLPYLIFPILQHAIR